MREHTIELHRPVTFAIGLVDFSWYVAMDIWSVFWDDNFHRTFQWPNDFYLFAPLSISLLITIVAASCLIAEDQVEARVKRKFLWAYLLSVTGWAIYSLARDVLKPHASMFSLASDVVASPLILFYFVGAFITMFFGFLPHTRKKTDPSTEVAKVFD